MVTDQTSFFSLKGARVDSKFVESLVGTLEEVWKNGGKKSLFSFVPPQLLWGQRKEKKALTSSDVDKFKVYAELAKESGISLGLKIRVETGYI